MTTPGTSTATDLDERYGRGGAVRRRRAVVIISGVIGAVALGWVAWAAWIQGTPEVQSTLRTFSVADDHTVRAEIAVQPSSADVRATCLLRAYASDHSVVGELNLRVPRSSSARVYRTSFRTERPATAVDLVGCTAPGQKQPR